MLWGRCCLPLRFGHIRSISESVRPHRVVRIASSGPKSGWSRGVDPRMGPAERRLGGGRRSYRFARRASWFTRLFVLLHGAARARHRLRGPDRGLGWPVGPIRVQNDPPTAGTRLLERYFTACSASDWGLLWTLRVVVVERLICGAPQTNLPRSSIRGQQEPI